MAMSLFKRSFALLATAAVAATLAFAALALLIMDRIYAEANTRVLGETVRALASGLPESILAPDEEGRLAAAAWAAGAVDGSELRLTLIRPDGVVIADTRADPSTMENHGSRPEVRAALAGALGSARRRSATIGRELVYAALPVSRGGPPLAVLRVAIEVPSLRARLSPEIGRLLILTLIFIAATAGAAAAFSRRLSLPLARLAQAARDYSAADFSAGLDAGGAGGRGRRASEAVSGRFKGRLGGDSRIPEEYRVLGGALDAMAAELAARIGEAESQGRELEAILDAMAEAVLALDERLRVRLANPAAAQLFGLARGPDSAPIKGRELLEVARSVELNAIVEDCLNSGRQRQAELALYQGGERWFQALAAPLSLPPTGRGPSPLLRGAEGASGSAKASAGVVLVLNDITELRRLERVRRDFVANVSHELRTPIQLIKGFAETLREDAHREEEGGGAGPEAVPDQRDRFLAIIERNAERMDNLIHDLLTLARLEQEGSDWLVFDDADICSALAEAVDAVSPRAEAKGIAIEVTCPEGLRARANTGLLEQAVLNLVDNAVKYSPRGSKIQVEAHIEDSGAATPGATAPGAEPRLSQNLALSVRDRGSGIPAKDLPRIFERFYRVDKARSRELGGTGLGLAIVRHIALAHGGTVSVESWEGEGSLFTIRIPLKDAQGPEPPEALGGFESLEDPRESGTAGTV